MSCLRRSRPDSHAHARLHSIGSVLRNEKPAAKGWEAEDPAASLLSPRPASLARSRQR